MESSSALFDPIPACIDSLSHGNFLVVLDSPSRENEGDLILAAQDMTPAKMAFMVRFTSGIICTPLPGSLATRLDLPLMIDASANADPNRTAYTVSIDAAAEDEGVTTGISAHDRSVVCQKLAAGGVRKEDFRRPGHVFPLRAREGGVRVRQGHTEAAVDLCRLAGKAPVGVIAEIVEEGEVLEGQAELGGNIGMARRDACVKFARRFGLKVCTIEDLVAYLEATEGKLDQQTNGHT